MTNEQPTHLDLFSGIGGFALAAGWAGFKTIGFSEIDPYCSAVLKKHWPNVTNYGDVRTVPAIGCDLLTGGFPCQPFSCAGKRRGAADDRHLWPAMLEVIRRCRPAWVVGENVPGIIGMALDDLCADLETAGYTVQPFVIPACAVDARHRRDRLWIVGHAASSGRIPGALTGIHSGEEITRPRNAEPERRGEILANAHQSRPQGRNGRELPERAGQRTARTSSASLADTEGEQEHWEGQGGFQPEPAQCSEDVAHANGHNGQWRRSTVQMGRQRSAQENKADGTGGIEWCPEPDVGRVAHGVPARVDRLRALGNAIVPQTVYPILKAIHDLITTPDLHSPTSTLQS